MRNTSLPHAPFAPAPPPDARHLTRILDATRRALRVLVDEARAWWQQYQHSRATDHALRELDAHGLRDIGIDRSEIPSFAAAAGGFGDPTRVRATHHPRRVAALL